MLRPEYLDDVGEELVVLFGELQTRIEADIARRILKGKYDTATAQWQREKLEEVGEFHKFLEKGLKGTMCKADTKLRNTLKKSVLISVAADKRIVKEAVGEVGIEAKPEVKPLETKPLEAKSLEIKSLLKAEGLNRIISAGYVQTRKRLKNFCNSMGSVAVGELRKHLDMANMEIKSGAFSAEQAIGNAVNSLAREGIRCIEYSNGKKISIEAGVRRAVISGINRTACEATLGMAEEMGVDLVKTTEHLGARPEHAVWQGRVFSLSGNGKYPDFYEETGYGEVDGLGGVNCRHSFYLFFEEYEEKKDYEAKIGDSKGNEKKYEAEREQRYNERKIREWKRRAEVMEGGGQNNAKEKEKVKEWQSRQRELVKKHNLARQYAREKVY
jgi:hypothetical protein